MASPLSSTTSPELTKKAVHLDQYSLEAPPPRTPSSPTTTTTTPQIITSSPSPNSQIIHRLRLVSFWDIAPGSLILEIGCGQGDTTVVLADAVGEKGHVDAIDPGPADYGAPYTLSQCQSHIKSSTPLGNRITFHNTTPTAYLSTYTGPAYDYIVLSHCIYYFANPSILPSILSSISSFGERKKEEGEKREMRLCVAEWSLSANSTTETDVRRKTPHILTALLLSLLETKRVTESQGNIRTVLSPSQITSAILSSPPPSQSQNRKWHLEAQLTLPTGDGMLDGFWEVSSLLQHRSLLLGADISNTGTSGTGTSAADGKESGNRKWGVEGDGKVRFENEAEKTAVSAMFDAVQAAVDALEEGVKGVRSMDFWVGRFLLGGD